VEEQRARAFDPTTYLKKSPQAFCTSKAILDFHLLEITSLLGLLNFSILTDKIGRIELAESSLQIWA